MKKIGDTIDNQVLVEMSPGEYRRFAHLGMAIEGKTIDNFRDVDARCMLPDLESVFGVIQAFAGAHYRINELQECIDALRKSSNNAEKKKEE